MRLFPFFSVSFEMFLCASVYSKCYARPVDWPHPHCRIVTLGGSGGGRFRRILFIIPPSLPHPPRTVRAVMEVTGSVQKSARLLHHAGLRNCRLLFCKHFVVNYITACCVLNYCKVAVSRDFLAIIFLLNGSTCALYELFLFRFREIFLFRKDIRILS